MIMMYQIDAFKIVLLMAIQQKFSKLVIKLLIALIVLQQIVLTANTVRLYLMYVLNAEMIYSQLILNAFLDAQIHFTKMDQ